MIPRSHILRIGLVWFGLSCSADAPTFAAPVTVGAGLGVAVPGGTLAENHATGLWGGIRVIAPWKAGFSGVAWADYQVLLGRSLEGFALADDMKILALGGGLRYTFDRTSSLRPSLEIGVGNYRFEQPDLFLEQKFGVYGGGTAEQDLGSRWLVALEATYHYTFTDRFIDHAQFFRFGVLLGLRLGG
jgi:hypothetical protein